jgi:oxygen-dependent protoporphyrinogen oxidase
VNVGVVGGGIAGLAAAWALSGRSEVEAVTVYEPGPLGGKVRTTAFAGLPVDEGPDAMITRTPDGLRLCQELGLGDDLVSPAAGRTLLWVDGRLSELPEGLVLGVPRQLGPLIRSGLLSPRAMARAGLDLVLPRSDVGGDLALWDLVAARFGPAVAERLVDPLVGSIYAGSTRRLSAEVTAPQILAAARAQRSLLLGLRRPRGRVTYSTGAPPAAFVTPRGGMGVLTSRLVERLGQRGVRFAAQEITGVRPGRSTSVAGPTVVVEGPDAEHDRAVLAVPAAVARRLLGPAAPGGLAQLRTASVVLTTLAFPAAELPVPAGINGILASRQDGRLMTACSFGSNKWPQWATPGTVVLRVSSGRDGDDRAMALGDEILVERLSAEVNHALGTHATPADYRVSRWPDSFPQPEVGHLARIAAIESELAGHLPTVALAGSAYRGAGIPACIASGRRAAEAVMARLG